MKNNIIKYNPALKKKARFLRKNSTLSEVLLWNKLKGRQLKGYQFLRQKPLNKYIVDFYCKRLRLAIVIDGDSHIDKEHSDIKRQKELESQGLLFLRFSDKQVKRNLNDVVQSISNWIDEYKKTENF
jgi:very-short-patch-repair endonuclease